MHTLKTRLDAKDDVQRLDWHSDVVGKKHCLICEWLPPAHAVGGPHGRRQPMEARRGQFHNASRREDGRSIVLQAHKAVGETPPPPLRPTRQPPR